MSEQIREQVSAFLDGELPDSETELLLKRLTRDGELRESFGRYCADRRGAAGRRLADRDQGLCLAGESRHRRRTGARRRRMPGRRARRVGGGRWPASRLRPASPRWPSWPCNRRAISPRVTAAAPVTAQNVRTVPTARATARQARGSARRSPIPCRRPRPTRRRYGWRLRA